MEPEIPSIPEIPVIPVLRLESIQFPARLAIVGRRQVGKTTLFHKMLNYEYIKNIITTYPKTAMFDSFDNVGVHILGKFLKRNHSSEKIEPLTIMTLEKPMRFTKYFDYIFMLKEKNNAILLQQWQIMVRDKGIYSYEQFIAILNACTEDYGCLVIERQTGNLYKFINDI